MVRPGDDGGLSPGLIFTDSECVSILHSGVTAGRYWRGLCQG